MFIGQHGSWNRSEFAGYKVLFVQFRNGRPSQPVEDFLTGFLADPKTGKHMDALLVWPLIGTGALLVAVFGQRHLARQRREISTWEIRVPAPAQFR